MKTYLTLAIFSLTLAACQGKKDSSYEQNDGSDVEISINSDYDITEDDEDDIIEDDITEESIELVIPILRDKLRDSGFEFVSENDFKNKLKTFFQIDTSNLDGENLISHQNFISYVDIGSSRLDNSDYIFGEFVYFNNIYFIKEFHFLIPLSFLIDLDEIEKDQIAAYIPEYVIHRNKYVFNGSQASLTWLLDHDIIFLFNLVTKFGYDGEERINDRLFISLYEKFGRASLEKRFEVLEDVFVRYDSKNNLDVRGGLFKSMLNVIGENDWDMLLMMRLYASKLLDEDTPFSIEEKYEVLSYLGYYEYLVGEKFDNISFTLFAGAPVLLDVARRGDQFEDHLKRNNYYNLPNYSEIMDQINIKMSFDEEMKREMDEMRKM